MRLMTLNATLKTSTETESRLRERSAMSLDRSAGHRCASPRRASFLPQEHRAGLTLADANLGKHLR
jgi:hypothetical protein